MDDRALMRIRAATAFTYDLRGRMLRSNEPRAEERRPAPRLFVGSTAAGQVVRLGATVPDALAERLRERVERQTPVRVRSSG